MRVYVPLTHPALAEAHHTGELSPAPGRSALGAYAVTPGLRRWYTAAYPVGPDAPEAALEELEYAAFGRAARASLRLLASDPEVLSRRIVLALDVPDDAVEPDPDGALDTGTAPGTQGGEPAGPGAVRIAGAVPLRKVAAVHMDEAGAEADVAAAVRLLDAADLGDEAARETVEDAEEHELLWFATQEIPALLKP
ncbi:hypothetical protein E0L36_00790 [Streptomyces sp. AJS327]|uniref:DUF6912 family protein n=1 Tax=Streptomyces sp. AJS327 TaxID=2545265 RepID=UPI0015DF03D7|nr:hypothetical protein [Streptomyces sp. AJS327]MBA0049499.1 hypothetical protein [Streptomyces sp. AJS327]